MKESQEHIVILAAWYPHPCDNMFGLFVQRHAELLAQHYQISVIFPSYCKEKKTGIFITVKNNVTNVNTNINTNNKLLRWLLFFILQIKAYKYIIQKHGKPLCSHAYILTREGLIALFFKWFYRIPYVITEQWSRYLFKKPFKHAYHAMLTKLVIRESNAISAISETLKKAMLAHAVSPKKPFVITRNIVDDNVFTIVKDNHEKMYIRKLLFEKYGVLLDVPYFINVSVFEDRSKNLSGLMYALHEIKKKTNRFILVLLGYGQDFDAIQGLAKKLDLQNNVIFTGEISPAYVATYLQSADFYVHPSHYETGRLAVAEAMMCGLPVVVSELPVFKEFVDSSCGYMVKPGQVNELAAAIELMLEDYVQFDKSYIRKKAQQLFSPQIVLQQFLDLYTYVNKHES